VGVAGAGAFKFDEHEQGAFAALDEDSAAEADLGITAGGRGDRDRRLVDKGAAGGVVAKEVAVASAEAEHPQVITGAAHEAAEVAFKAAAVERRGVSGLDGVIAFADGMNGIAGAGAGRGDEHEAIGGAGRGRGDAGDDAAKTTRPRSSVWPSRRRMGIVMGGGFLRSVMAPPSQRAAEVQGRPGRAAALASTSKLPGPSSCSMAAPMLWE
jgi:hypothetical protein